MKEMTCLISLGWFAIFVLQIVRPREAFRVTFLLVGSLAFLLYCSPNFFIFAAMIGWLLLIYCIALGSKVTPPLKKNWTRFYIGLIIAVFILFKLNWLSTGEKNPLLEAAMPLGFSFLMFQSIALLLDVENEVLEPVPPLKYVLTSGLFFPTFSVGPFQKLQNFLHSTHNQWCGRRTFEGYCWFCLGIFKFSVSGLLLRPNLLNGLPLAYQAKSNVHPYNFLILASVFLFTNFSGFSDIVVGLAKMMGYDVPLNFRFPFLSLSVADYWRKWHISLGAWFREYLHYPVSHWLATNRWRAVSPKVASSLSIFFTFLLIGLWHQLSLKFFVYSTVNAALVAFFMTKNRNGWFGIPVTFIVTLLINALFLSQDLADFKNLVNAIIEGAPSLINERNFKIAIFTFALLGIFYGAERLIDKIARDRESASPLIVVINFAMAFAMLFFGITLGIGPTESVYVGY